MASGRQIGPAAADLKRSDDGGDVPGSPKNYAHEVNPRGLHARILDHTGPGASEHNKGKEETSSAVGAGPTGRADSAPSAAQGRQSGAKDDGKHHILVAGTGSVACVKLPLIVEGLSRYADVEVQVILTETAARFVDPERLLAAGASRVWRDSDEWKLWSKISDPVLHIELRKWAHLMLIAPLSADMLARAANGLCDNLLGSVIRAWSTSVPMFAAPAMNTAMWTHPITKKQLEVLSHLPYFETIYPIEKVLACKDVGMGAMAEWGDCVGYVAKKLGLKRDRSRPLPVREESSNTFLSTGSSVSESLGSTPADDDDEGEDDEDEDTFDDDAETSTETGNRKLAHVSTHDSQASEGIFALDNEAPPAPSQTSTRPFAVSLPDGSQHEEYQYLDLIKLILERGEVRPDRTGTGTVALFAPPQLRFSLRNGRFPLLTTKRVFYRGVAEELLWFVRGDTNARHLAEKDVHIWDGNGSREYLDRIGLKDREEGDLGPVYGFQWRHFGAKYIDCHTDYTGQGVDQLAQVIHKIKTNPYDRRIIMSAWNAADLSQMALPPCHVLCQFSVSERSGEVSCLLFQRSCDMGLGVPFNIASYALLLRMVAHVCERPAGDLIILMGDCHIYSNHVEALRQQITRVPRDFPTLSITRKVGSIDGFTMDDFSLNNYKPHPSIKMDMAV